MAASQGTTDDESGLYTGWIAGALVITAVLATGAFFWFRYHP